MRPSWSTAIPETVSTDYDTSDRLYFEPLTAEDVLEIIRTEQSNGTVKGVIVQFGGQTPLKLAEALEEAGVPILGTSPDAIDLAEDRDRFKALIDKLGLQAAGKRHRRARRQKPAPLPTRSAIRWSSARRYVLGGRGHGDRPRRRRDRPLHRTPVGHARRPIRTRRLRKRPLLIDRYLTDAVEVDVDCLSDGKDTFIAGVMEHIEEAGIHSGDSACSLPPHSLGHDMIAELERQARALAQALNVVGLMNVQFAIKDEDVYILEVNPRASRTVPFVAKVIGKPIAGIASRVMAGEKLPSLQASGRTASTTSRSRKPCSRSPASPASIRSSARKCARRARSWASTAISRWPSARASSAPARRCRRRDVSSFR